jgi:hypothetical protein
MTAQELGAMGELFVMRQLEAVGLEVERAGGADLLVEGVPIEVKAARPKPYRRGYRGYQFCLRKPGHTDHRKARAVVLLCCWDPVADPVAFVIPSDRLGDRRKVTIPNRRPWAYGGKWARWYRRWETLADILGVE